ncbi:MAG: hypothetical protein ACRD6R_14475 [Candidatus Polarisedimenticolia bacterium]
MLFTAGLASLFASYESVPSPYDDGALAIPMEEMAPGACGNQGCIFLNGVLACSKHGGVPDSNCKRNKTGNCIDTPC